MDMQPHTPFNRLLMRLINRCLLFYEEHLAYIIPGQELLFVLEVVSKSVDRKSLIVSQKLFQIYDQ